MWVLFCLPADTEPRGRLSGLQVGVRTEQPDGQDSASSGLCDLAVFLLSPRLRSSADGVTVRLTRPTAFGKSRERETPGLVSSLHCG